MSQSPTFIPDLLSAAPSRSHASGTWGMHSGVLGRRALLLVTPKRHALSTRSFRGTGAGAASCHSTSVGTASFDGTEMGTASSSAPGRALPCPALLAVPHQLAARRPRGRGSAAAPWARRGLRALSKPRLPQPSRAAGPRVGAKPRPRVVRGDIPELPIARWQHEPAFGSAAAAPRRCPGYGGGDARCREPTEIARSCGCGGTTGWYLTGETCGESPGVRPGG